MKIKKNILSIGIIGIIVIFGVLSGKLITHSEEFEDSNYNSACFTDLHKALEAAKVDWQNNLKDLKKQEKPASEMVEDAYEGLRTYNCWAEYICKAVEYSGHAPIESALGTGLTTEHLGKISGCQKVENLKMGDEYSQLTEYFKSIPVIGIADEIVEKTFINNKINYFSNCQTNPLNNNQNPSLSMAKENYAICRRELEFNFGCPKNVEDSECSNYSNAFVTIDTVLKKKQAEQKSSALEKKLDTIIPKLNSMEEHVGYLANFLKSLDSRFECYAKKCD